MKIVKQTPHRGKSTDQHRYEARHRNSGVKTRTGLKAGQRPATLDGWNH